MPAFAWVMNDDQVAAVATYIRNSWGNKGEPATADDVKNVRAALGTHPQPTSSDEMMKMPE